ncbi:MAG: class II aldolase/adducin family protein [Pseudomonadota bacterium]
MTTRPQLLTPAFRSLSARLGNDPLQVQGPGGNTSIKDDDVMWIKASGTELANAEDQDIFVPVNRHAAAAEAVGQRGDGSCKDTVIDRSIQLRPSIETTFHAALGHPVVVHTHSVATLAHAISPQGRKVCAEKLEGLPYALVPYAKPGLPLTRQILKNIKNDTKIIVLQNHGLICCGDTVYEVASIVEEVEKRLALPVRHLPNSEPSDDAPEGFLWADEGWLAFDERASVIATAGSYYPDHVVFLGPAIPTSDHISNPPAILVRGLGVALRAGATPVQKTMLHCLSDVLARLPEEWDAEPIGNDAEAELLDWDAEKYRQALAASK